MCWSRLRMIGRVGMVTVLLVYAEWEAGRF